MNVPFEFPDLLLPAESVPINTWPVIACDQFTADESYWRRVAETVGDNPSTLHLILPEVYLEGDDQAEREERIRTTMRRYRDEGVFQTIPGTAVYVRRHLANGTIRRGIVVALDLDAYDFDPQQRSLVRASEETIPERLPPRASIRRGAAVESPHVLVLFDDPEDRVVSFLEENHDSLEKLYEASLMLGGGAVEGYALPTDSAVAREFVTRVASLSTYDDYGYAMATGDGNHSLAAAKTVWQERKAAGAPPDDPYRYCLVEIVNVYDPGLPFHPIHRFVEVDETKLFDSFLQGSDARFHGFQRQDLLDHLHREGLAAHEIAIIGPVQSGVLSFPSDSGLAVAIADGAIARSEPRSVDYIHGLEEVITVADQHKAVAIVLPEIDRGNLFSTVAAKGALPRKAFSLGEAQDKRYYLECRALES